MRTIPGGRGRQPPALRTCGIHETDEGEIVGFAEVARVAIVHHLRDHQENPTRSKGTTSMDPDNTAVLAIHWQRDIVTREGAFGEFFGQTVERTGVVERTAGVLASARERRIPIFYTRVCFSEGHPELLANSPLLNLVGQTKALVDGSPGAEIVPELSPRPGDVVVNHTRVAGTQDTNLIEQLQARESRASPPWACRPTSRWRNHDRDWHGDQRRCGSGGRRRGDARRGEAAGGMRATAMHAIGIVTLLVGVSNFLEYDNPLVPLVSVILGLLVGEFCRIEDRLKRLGDSLEKWFSRGESPVSRAFVTTSLLFCVGPLTVIGSLEDGLRGDYDLLALKSALDFIAALTFASVLGWGVLLSAGTVLVVQGALTLGAGSSSRSSRTP